MSSFPTRVHIPGKQGNGKRFLSAPDRPMETLTKAGRYEIVGELGRGAMGVVYKAVDPVIGRTVAVKTIRLSEEGTGMSRQELLERFQMEARAAGLLTHPNIVVIHDVGQEEGGLYYITMELVEGKSLQAQLDAQQAFPLPRVLRIMEQTCSALQFAHERNVVHRDIKPANLMLTADDTVKVTDFGTAKILQFGTANQTAQVIGTPSYMSPEQVKGRAVDGRSDLFSLGVVLYEVITGQKPFPGQNITTVIYKIVNESPVPPRRIDPSIHPGINQVMMKALEKDPGMRYQTCRELLDDLKNYRSLDGSAEATMVIPIGQAESATASSPTVRLPAPTPAPAPSASAVRRTGPIEPLQSPKKKSKVASALLALALLAVIGYCGYWLRPQMRDLWLRTHGVHQEVPNPDSGMPADPSAPPAAGDAVNATSTAVPSEGPSAKERAANEEPTPDSVKATSLPEKAAPKKAAPLSSNVAAEFRRRIEQDLIDAGLDLRVKVEGAGNTLTLSGKLRPQEHRDLLKHLRAAPASVRIVDHIEHDDTPAAGSAEPAALGLLVNSKPHGAEVFIDGAKQSGQTPLTLPLAQGEFNILIRKEGYEPYAGHVQVKDGIQTQLDVELTPRTVHVAWVMVRSQPRGAEIFVDGNTTGQFTPARVQMTSGMHAITLELPGFSPATRKVAVDEGQTVHVFQVLKLK